jgi:hypothetical protein
MVVEHALVPTRRSEIGKREILRLNVLDDIV